MEDTRFLRKLRNFTSFQYTYDALGEKTSEQATANGQTIENATAGYDALGRMTSWAESGALLAGTATNYSDDGNGNATSTGVIDRAMGGGTFSYAPPLSHLVSAATAIPIATLYSR